ncbi:hypothetical protein IEQ34_003956 [Dendrobium chrysotoxum]|uniref:Auxin-responsive protein n=1 Tax=Dendrobium chrysotoxum TaxID=161865 RepID=A0AAV7HGU8_DENCH|nr:hypothetical protein IEQ34_003956 [Dendrobium chrysotoxum]
MTKGGPWAEFLEAERGAASGVEGSSSVGGGGEGAECAGAGRGETSKESLEEVRSELLVKVTIRGSKFVEHPHELLNAGAVAGCDSAGTIE